MLQRLYVFIDYVSKDESVECFDVNENLLLSIQI